MNLNRCLLMLFVFANVVGCKSYSKFSIDEHPTIKIDSGLLGIWKPMEDTDKSRASFILIQSPYDIFRVAKWWRGLDSAGMRSYLSGRNLRDTIATKMFLDAEITDKEAEFQGSYSKFTTENNSVYYISYFDRHGKSMEDFNQWSAFYSKVKDALFLNIPYRYIPKDSIGQFLPSSFQKEGFFFVKIININPTYDTITTAIVADTTLKYFHSSEFVRRAVEQHADDPTFYSDTLHFYKVSGYHVSATEAEKIANGRR